MPQHGSSYVDDLTIEDDAPLWRRVPPWHFVFDENLGRPRPSKAAFEDHPDGSPMSVALGQEVLESGRTAESLLEEYDRFGLASFIAGFAREKGQGVVRSPLPEEPAHAEVFGKKTEGVRRAFAKKCIWVVPPPIGGIG